MAGPLQPLFFVTRADGSMIPLLAVDELPKDLKFGGVKSQLTPHDIGGMIAVGSYNHRNRSHQLVKPIPPPTPSIVPTDRSLSASRYATTGDCAFSRPLLSPHARPRAYGIDEQPPSHSGTEVMTEPAKKSQSTVKDPGQPAALPPWHKDAEIAVGTSSGVKEYCSYWLRNGECDYAQQGCIYRHEMPLDRTTLTRLGLLDIPRWYREKHGLASYRASDNHSRPMPVTRIDRARRSRTTAPITRSLQAQKLGNQAVATKNSMTRLPPPTQAKLLLGSAPSSLSQTAITNAPRAVVIPPSFRKTYPSSSARTEDDGKIVEIREYGRVLPAQSQLEMDNSISRFRIGENIRFRTVVPDASPLGKSKAKDVSEDDGDNELSSQASTRSPITSASDADSTATVQSVIGTLSLSDVACTDTCCGKPAESVVEKPTQASNSKSGESKDLEDAPAPVVAIPRSIVNMPTVVAKAQPAIQQAISSVPYQLNYDPVYARRGGRKRNDARAKRQLRRAQQIIDANAAQKASDTTPVKQPLAGPTTPKQDLLLDFSEA